VLGSSALRRPEELSVSSPQHATATFTEESASKAIDATYQSDDFEQDASESKSSAAPFAAPVPAAKAAPAKAAAVATAAATSPRPPLPGGPAQVQQPRPPLVHTAGVGTGDGDGDPSYRPRRPTCEVGTQVSMAVDVGVQCDPPMPDMPSFGVAAGLQAGLPAGLEALFGSAGNPQAAAAAVAAATAAAAQVLQAQAFAASGYPSAMPFGAMGLGPFGGPPAAPSYGWAPASHSALPAALSANPLLRQLYATSIVGGAGGSYGGCGGCGGASGGGFELQRPQAPREAWGPMAASQPWGGLGAMSGPCFGGAGPGMPPGGLGGPAGLAMSMVDDSFRQQVDVLKQALAKHRALLEMSRPSHLSGPGGPMNFMGTAFPQTAASVAPPYPPIPPSPSVPGAPADGFESTSMPSVREIATPFAAAATCG